jgi:hypothetical protein
MRAAFSSTATPNRAAPPRASPATRETRDRRSASRSRRRGRAACSTLASRRVPSPSQPSNKLAQTRRLPLGRPISCTRSLECSCFVPTCRVVEEEVCGECAKRCSGLATADGHGCSTGAGNPPAKSPVLSGEGDRAVQLQVGESGHRQQRAPGIHGPGPEVLLLIPCRLAGKPFAARGDMMGGEVAPPPRMRRQIPC